MTETAETAETVDTARLVEGLREQTEGFIRAVAGGAPDTRVPTCPDWPLRTLVATSARSTGGRPNSCA